MFSFLTKVPQLKSIRIAAIRKIICQFNSIEQFYIDNNSSIELSILRLEIERIEPELIEFIKSSPKAHELDRNNLTNEVIAMVLMTPEIVTLVLLLKSSVIRDERNMQMDRKNVEGIYSVLKQKFSKDHKKKALIEESDVLVYLIMNINNNLKRKFNIK